MHMRQPQPTPAPFRFLRSVRIVTALACTGVTLHPALRAADPLPAAIAAPATAETGVIEGRVFNAASGTYLNNARVTVEGTNLQTYTNDRGEFRLRNVPAGEANLKVSYAGQEDLRETVPVSAGATAATDFTFNSKLAKLDGKTVVLDKFVVEATRFKNAQELATNEERASLNIKSVIATDSLGYVRDGNVGEFVKFLPGVDVSNGDLGAGSNPDNATTVAVRGFGADSTQILVDGMPIASGSPNALTRAVQLDALSVNNASRLEIIKVPTPDMSTDAPGGTINLITRGAFELPKATYNVSLAFNGSTHTPDVFKKTPGPYEPNFKTLPSVRFSGSIPLTRTLGMSFSVSSDNKYSLTSTSNMRDWLYTGRNTLGSGTLAPVQNAQGGIRIDNPLIERFEIVENQWIEHRHSGNLRFDWRPIDGLEIRVNGQVSVNEGTGVVRRTQWRYGTNTAGGFAVKDWGEGYVTGYQRTATYVPNGLNASMTVDARDREGFTTQGYITAKYRKGPWSVDASVTASESYTNTPDNTNQHFSSVDASITPGRMDVTGIKEGIVGRIDIWNATGTPIDYGSLSNWNPILVLNGDFRARSSQSANRDVNKEYKLDVAREIEFLPFPLTVKMGGKQVAKSNRKWGLGATYEKRYIGPTIANADIESEYTSEAEYGYAGPQRWVDPHKIYQIYENNPEYFTDSLVSPTLNVNLPAINYLSKVGSTKALTETATEYYAMATASFFQNRLLVITGARQSRKDREGSNLYNNVNWNYVTNADGTRYRDSVYTLGVRFDGGSVNYGTGDPRSAGNVVMTDAALRTRMQAAGVEYLPTKLELAPNGTAMTNVNQNLFMAMRNRYTRKIDASLTQPWTPQLQVAYEISDTLRAQIAWSRETRVPDLEGTDTSLLVAGANFQVNEAATPSSSPGGDGTITLANINGKPEVNESINAKLSYYPKNGRGKYSVSYYYKVVDNSWRTIDVYNTDSLYDTLLGTMGLSSSDYENYRITTIDTQPFKQVRKGFEVELAQNFGIFGPWGNGIDAFVTYTRRPVTARAPSTALGFIPLTPVRAKWTGGLSYSARRFSVQGRFTFTEAGITHGAATNVALPDGTTQAVQFYNLNKVPPEVNLQANYVINKNFTVFATANRILTGRVTTQIADTQTGYMPEWASWRNAAERGVALAMGVNATF